MSRLAERLLNRADHRFAVGVLALVGQDLAQLGLLELFEARLNLRSVELVVAQDRERRPDAGGPTGPVGTAHDAVNGDRPAGTLGGGPDPGTTARQQRLDLTDEVVALRAAMTHELGDEIVGVLTGDPTAGGGVIERVLNATARGHHEV